MCRPSQTPHLSLSSARVGGTESAALTATRQELSPKLTEATEEVRRLKETVRTYKVDAEHADRDLKQLVAETQKAVVAANARAVKAKERAEKEVANGCPFVADGMNRPAGQFVQAADSWVCA